MKIFLFLGIFLVLNPVQTSVHIDDLEASMDASKVNKIQECIPENIENIVTSEMAILPNPRILSQDSFNVLQTIIESNSENIESQKINFWLKLNSDILVSIGEFLSVPQRELGRVDKSISQIFLRYNSFHRIVSEYFGIPELLLAERYDDLIWFEDKFRVFKKDPNHFFILLLHALLVENKFSFSSKLLCKYILRVYKNFNLEMVKYFYQNISTHVSLFCNKFAEYLDKQQYYDLLIHCLLNNPDFLFVDSPNTLSRIFYKLRLPFYQELFLDPHGVVNFHNFYSLGHSILVKSNMISGILATDKSVGILITCLNNLNTDEEKYKLLTDSFHNFFINIQDIENFEIEELNGIYERNLVLFSDAIIASFNLNNRYRLLNEIYFASSEIFTDEYIIENLSLNDHFIRCSMQKNRKRLFLRLLNLEDKCKYNFIYQIKNIFKPNNITINSIWEQMNHYFYAIELSETNLEFYIKFYEKYPERKIHILHHENTFENILKFYFMSDFIGLSEQCTSFSIIMELKQQYRNQNRDLPLNFVYHYNKKKFPSNSSDFLLNFSGSNENSLIQLIKVLLRLNTRTDHFVCDTVLKMIMTSENILNSISSHMPNFKILIDSKQLMRLIKSERIKVEDLIRIEKLVRYDIYDFDCFNSDSDFIAVETLTGKTILDLLIKIFKKIASCKFQTFVKIRKALHYLLKTDRESLECIQDKVIIEFFIKEATEEIGYLLQPVTFE